VYRGAKKSNEDESASFKGVVYVSTDPESAAQWGKVSEYEVVVQPDLLDLGNWNADGAKVFVARAMGEDKSVISSWSKDDFDENAADVFIQGSGVENLSKFGYNGMRLGTDVLLVGKLSDYAKNKSEKADLSSLLRKES